jgi:hypothetical protein
VPAAPPTAPLAAGCPGVAAPVTPSGFFAPFPPSPPAAEGHSELVPPLGTPVRRLLEPAVPVVPWLPSSPLLPATPGAPFPGSSVTPRNSRVSESTAINP